jgi:hypothetical protein
MELLESKALVIPRYSTLWIIALKFYHNIRYDLYIMLPNPYSPLPFMEFHHSLSTSRNGYLAALKRKAM